MKTVMVVDDVPANVDVVLGLLHESGCRVLVADSGDLKKIRQFTVSELLPSAFVIVP